MSSALLILSAISMTGNAQKLATLEVNLGQPSVGLEVPVHAGLDPITHLPDSVLDLVEVNGSQRTPVPFQIEGTSNRILTWMVSDDQKSRRYELVKNPSSHAKTPLIEAVLESGALTLKAENRQLLRYHSEPVYPPKGIDPVFTRSAFIHPLWSPHGQILTRIHAPDHYHHFGIWNPWTHVLFEGDTVDFWNLKAKQGTVRFGGFISTTSGNVFGEYSALHEHVVFPKNGNQKVGLTPVEESKEKIAIREAQTVRIYTPRQSADYYIADITVQMNCAENPVRLLEYRYGGLGWRATEQWTKENSRVLSSEGKTRMDADGSKARWCIVEGPVDGENAGAVMMSHPVNYNHPEPLRIWPENSNGNRGDMFANFSPTKDTDWLLEPGKNYVLRYRLIVFNGDFKKEQAEAGWKYFASPPTVTVLENSR